MLTATEYNYKLRSVIGRENESKVRKWTWFDKQARTDNNRCTTLDVCL